MFHRGCILYSSISSTYPGVHILYRIHTPGYILKGVHILYDIGYRCYMVVLWLDTDTKL